KKAALVLEFTVSICCIIAMATLVAVELPREAEQTASSPKQALEPTSAIKTPPIALPGEPLKDVVPGYEAWRISGFQGRLEHAGHQRGETVARQTVQGPRYGIQSPG